MMALAALLSFPPATPAQESRPAPLAVLGGREAGLSRMQRPSSVSFDAFGHLFVADRGTHRVLEFDDAWKPVRSIGGFGFDVGHFVDPRSVVADRGSRVYVLDAPAGRVQALDARREPEGVLLGSSGQSLGVHRPFALGVDASGTMYLSDRESQSLWVVSPDGDSLGNWGGFGSGPGQFRRIAGVTVDGQGEVWVADELLRRVVHFDRAGAFVGAFRVAADSVKASRPMGVAVAEDGRIAVADPGLRCVTVFSPAGARLASIEGSPDEAFKDPVAVAWRGSRLAVADQGLHEVLVFDVPPAAR